MSLYTKSRATGSTGPRLRSRRAASILRWSQFVFLVMGLTALGYCVYAVLEAKLYQAYQERQFQRAQQLQRAQQPQRNPQTQKTGDVPWFDMGAEMKATSPDSGLNPGLLAEDSTSASDKSAGDLPGGKAPDADFPLGRIEIARIGLGAMIMEGLGERTLRHAIGHVPATPAPEQPGNVALAGHRDTFFRPLHNIRKDDEIILTTL